MTDTRLISFNAGDPDALVFEKLNQLSGQVTGLLDAPAGGGAAFRGTLAKKAADQTALNATGGVLVAWDGADVYDTDSIHDPSSNNSQLIVPSSSSYARIEAQVSLSSVTNDVIVLLEILKGGSAAYDGFATFRLNITNSAPTVRARTPILPVSPTDYFEAKLTVVTDTSVTIEAEGSWFAMQIIE